MSASLADLKRAWLLVQLGITESDLSLSDLETLVYGNPSVAGVPQQQYAPSGVYLCDDHGLASANSSLNVLDTMYFKPFFVADDITITDLLCSVSTVGLLGNTIDLAIYLMEAGVPTDLMASVEDIDVTGSTGAKTGTLAAPVALSKGLYAAATRLQTGTAAVMSGSANHQSKHISVTPSGNNVQGYAAAGVVGALPATAPAVSSAGNGVIPRVWLKVAGV